jgi:Protein of unknown function (DUF1579)
MKRMTPLAFVVFLFATTATAQMDSATMMKNWMNYMTPGKEHKWLSDAVGSWTAEISMWMSPNTAPTKSIGKTTNTMILGGRYQQSHHQGDFMGQPFEGQSTLAFDNLKKVFISTWIDNMGTGMMIGEGPWDEKTQTVAIKGTMMDPMTGKQCNFREVFKVVDNDHQLLEMYAPDPATGKEFKTMEIRYSRNK